MANSKRPSDRQVRRRFSQYHSFDECPIELQTDYLHDLYLRYTQSPDPDIRDFIEFMEILGELPKR